MRLLATSLMLALALGSAGAARADLTLVRERLAALHEAPIAPAEDPARRKELAFFWRELTKHDARLPRTYQLLRPRLVMAARKARSGLLDRMSNQIRKEFRAALGLLLQAALLAHEDLLTDGDYARPDPERARPVVEAALPVFQGPTDHRNLVPRSMALAALAELDLPGDPGRQALERHRLLRAPTSDSFGRGLRAIVAPYTPALGEAMDQDLAALRQAWGRATQDAPPTPTPSPAASPSPAPPPATVAPTPTPTPPPRPRRRRKLYPIVLGLMALAAGGGYAAARRRAAASAASPDAAPPPPAPIPEAPSPPATLPADARDTDPPGRPSAPPDAPPEGPDPLPLLAALEDLRGRVVHSLTGRFAIAKVLEDEPERFAEAFLTDGTLGESAELLEGLVAALEELPDGPGDLAIHVEKLQAARPRYAKLASFLSRAREEVAAGRRPRDMAEFQRRLVKIAAHFKEVNQRLREARKAYQVDLEDLVEDRAEAFAGRLRVDVAGPGETDLLRTGAAGARADLGLALDTLLENAFQAGAREVRAHFADAGPEAVRLELVDDGEGLGDNAPEDLMRSGFSTRELGTGTGLPQARRLVQACGGTLALAADEGGGARVTLELPVEPPPA